MTVVLSCQLHTARHDFILHAKSSRAKVARASDPILYRHVEPMRHVIGLLQFRDPFGPGTVEDELHVVLARMIHERFCCKRGYAVPTGVLATQSVNILP